MPDAGFDGTIEVVRGRVSDDRATQLIDFWTGHGALTEEQAGMRLNEVVCVALDPAGEVVGVNSVFGERIPLIGDRLFWVYRSALLPAAWEANREMIAAAFGALEQEFEPGRQGPLGLCVLADRAEAESRPEAEWRDPRLVYAGHTADGQQVRVGYFAGAKIGPGSAETKTPSEGAYALEPGYRVEFFAEQDSVSEQDVIDLWTGEGAMEPEEAGRRVSEVFMTATGPDGALAGLCTVYLRHNEQLGMDCWHYRTFVAPAHRRSNVAQQMNLSTRERLSERFASGEDTRAAALIVEVSGDALQRSQNDAVLQPSDYTFIGENARGWHVRVHYFPGAEAPTSSSA